MAIFLSFLAFALASTVVASVGNGVGRRGLRMENNLKRTADIEGCFDITHWWFLYDSYMDESYTLADVALDYITSQGISDPVFTAYFGTGLENYTLQTDIFSILTDDNALVLSCSDPRNSCTNNADISHFGTYSVDDTLYFCSNFFNQPSITSLCTGTSVDSGLIRGGTMLHEVSRAVYGTGYSTGSCSDARALATSDPYAAGRTADNYNCFAMQVYANTEC